MNGKTNLVILAIVLIVTPVFAYNYFTSKEGNTSAVKVTSNSKGFGLTVSKFQKSYERLVAENSVPALSIKESYSEEEKSKFHTYFLTSSNVALDIETNKAKTEIYSVTVFAEPDKGTSEKKVLQRATLAYIFAIQTLRPDIPEKRIGNIVNKLSEYKSLTLDDMVLDFSVYNGILMLSAKAK